MALLNISKVNGNTIDASEWNQFAGINNFITNSGLTPSTTNLQQMGIASARYASAGQFFEDTSSVPNNYILSPVAPFRSPVSSTAGEGYFIGMKITFKTANANTSASTVNVNSLGTKSLKKSDGTTDIAAGNIPANQYVSFIYNGTHFAQENKIQATTIDQGVIEIATNAETIAGTDTGRAIVPSALAALFGTSDRSSNGYARLPVKVAGAFVEIIIQWGIATVSTTGTVVTLPISYTTINAIVLGNGDLSGITMVAQSKTLTNFTGFKSGTGSAGCPWISIGY